MPNAAHFGCLYPNPLFLVGIAGIMDLSAGTIGYLWLPTVVSTLVPLSH